MELDTNPPALLRDCLRSGGFFWHRNLLGKQMHHWGGNRSVRLNSKTVENICRKKQAGGGGPWKQKWPVFRKSFVAPFGLKRHKQIKVLSFGGDCIFQTSWISVYFLTCHQADVYWFPLSTTKLITFWPKVLILDYEGGEVRLFSSPRPIKARPCVLFLLDQVTKSNAVSEVRHLWSYLFPWLPFVCLLLNFILFFLPRFSESNVCEVAMWRHRGE